MSTLTPREIVAELDKFVVGQEQAKRMVAVAVRNRWRRQHLPEELRDEVAPKNIIMMGPTGVGKTEIARRLAKLSGAPFIKVEATKFTEVGYVGRDVESMVRDLMEIGINLVREEENARVRAAAEAAAESRLLDLLLPNSFGGDRNDTREKLRQQFRLGFMDDREVEVEVTEQPAQGMDMFAIPGMEQMGNQVREAGFTTVYSTPGSGNVIGGTGVSIKLRGHTAREMAIPGSEQMKFAFGENPKRNYGARKQTPATRMGLAGILRETLFNAKNYSDKLKAAETDPSKAPEPNFQLNALVPVVRGQMRCRMHAHRSDDILTAISIAEEFGLDYVIEHCTEGYKIADVLNEKQVRCVIGPHLTAPSKMEIHGRSLDTPGILAKEPNMTVALTADTGSQTAVLPMTIGMLIRHGLSFEDALRGVTINPAKILQLEDRIGSLEPGKDADIAIFDGNLFDSMSLCRLVMIDGEIYKNTL